MSINFWTWNPHAPPIGWFLLDFVLFVWLLVHFGKKPLQDFFAKRSNDVRRRVVEAADAHAKASQRRSELSQKRATLEPDVKDMLARSRVDAERESSTIVQSAEKLAASVCSDVEKIVRQEQQTSSARVYAHAVACAFTQAETALRTASSAPTEQAALLDRAIAELEGMA